MKQRTAFLPGPGAGAAVTAAGVFSNIMEAPGLNRKLGPSFAVELHAV